MAGVDLHDRALVVDVHTHGTALLPQPARGLYRLVNRLTMPGDVALGELAAAGVDAVVAKAVGDPIVTRWYRGGAWAAVLAQLERLRADAEQVGARVVSGAAAIRAAGAHGRTAVVLGLEGADAIGDDLSRLDQLRRLGVRVVVPVHLGDNQLGTTCLPWQRYVGPLPVRRRRASGLTELGRRAVALMNDLGIVVDLAHADRATTLEAVAASRHPVISSHTGARALQDFARFLSDDELRAVAATGGLVGLWPYRHRGRGVADVADLVAHARHVAGLVGAEHLCLGTDMNGVPGLMEGYRGEHDLRRVTEALLAGGFSEAEVQGVLGENFLRVLEAVESG
jgi:microsomal dipeptidase-like Zn-dependent dipeptidase